MNSPYNKSIDEISQTLQTDIVLGLTRKEAEKRIGEYGKNILTVKNQRRVWGILFGQILHPIILVLLIAGVLAFLFGEILGLDIRIQSFTHPSCTSLQAMATDIKIS